MLAHLQGGLVNVAQLARNIGIEPKTAAQYLDLMVDLLLVRRLPPWHSNTGKRLVKSPKVYVRDSGLLHALLGIVDRDGLLSHPIVGMSWEGWVVENALNVAPEGVHGHFFRTSGGAEIDLVLRFPSGELWAVEVKRSLAPRPERPRQGGDEAERLRREDLVVLRADRTEDLDPFLRESGDGGVVGHGGLLVGGRSG